MPANFIVTECLEPGIAKALNQFLRSKGWALFSPHVANQIQLVFWNWGLGQFHSNLTLTLSYNKGIVRSVLEHHSGNQANTSNDRKSSSALFVCGPKHSVT